MSAFKPINNILFRFEKNLEKDKLSKSCLLITDKRQEKSNVLVRMEAAYFEAWKIYLLAKGGGVKARNSRVP